MSEHQHSFTIWVNGFDYCTCGAPKPPAQHVSPTPAAPAGGEWRYVDRTLGNRGRGRVFIESPLKDRYDLGDKEDFAELFAVIFNQDSHLNALTADLAAARARVKELHAEIDNSERRYIAERNAARARIEELETDNDRLRKRLDSAEREAIEVSKDTHKKIMRIQNDLGNAERTRDNWWKQACEDRAEAERLRAKAELAGEAYWFVEVFDAHGAEQEKEKADWLARYDALQATHEQEA